jgi:hypothetical protein
MSICKLDIQNYFYFKYLIFFFFLSVGFNLYTKSWNLTYLYFDVVIKQVNLNFILTLGEIFSIWFLIF